jgi:hypothetical protein
VMAALAVLIVHRQAQAISHQVPMTPTATTLLPIVPTGGHHARRVDSNNKIIVERLLLITPV